MVWCDCCATWRTSVSADTGACRVCRMRERLEGREDACAEALEAMTAEQRATYEESESLRGRRKPYPPRPKKPPTDGMTPAKAAKVEDAHLAALEAWELERVRLDYDAAKTRLRRMREKAGTNPRKKV